MEFEFSSKEELYHHVKPALKAKKSELKKTRYDYIQEVDLWNYLIKNKWTKAHDLTLFDIVQDIMHLDWKDVDAFLKEEHKKQSQNNQNLEVL